MFTYALLAAVALASDTYTGIGPSIMDSDGKLLATTEFSYDFDTSGDDKTLTTQYSATYSWVAGDDMSDGRSAAQYIANTMVDGLADKPVTFQAQFGPNAMFAIEVSTTDDDNVYVPLCQYQVSVAEDGKTTPVWSAHCPDNGVSVNQIEVDSDKKWVVGI